VVVAVLVVVVTLVELLQPAVVVVEAILARHLLFLLVALHTQLLLGQAAQDHLTALALTEGIL
jgi:hypothetical protein